MLTRKNFLHKSLFRIQYIVLTGTESLKAVASATNSVVKYIRDIDWLILFLPWETSALLLHGPFLGLLHWVVSSFHTPSDSPFQILMNADSKWYCGLIQAKIAVLRLICIPINNHAKYIKPRQTEWLTLLFYWIRFTPTYYLIAKALLW